MAKRSRQQSVPYPRGARVAVCVPVHLGELVHSRYSYNESQLIGYSSSVMMGRECTALQLIYSHGTLIADQRIDLTEKAIGFGATHILWLDSDMRFPKEALQVLLHHDKDIVGANYSERNLPPRFTALKRINPEERCITYDDSEGLEKVEAIAFGCVLTKVKVFKSLPQPWFEIPYVPDFNGFQGEDVSFCKRATIAGYDVWVDHELSKYVRHIGTMEYTHLHALDTLEHIRRTAEGMADATNHELHNASDRDRKLA